MIVSYQYEPVNSKSFSLSLHRRSVVITHPVLVGFLLLHCHLIESKGREMRLSRIENTVTLMFLTSDFRERSFCCISSSMSLIFCLRDLTSSSEHSALLSTSDSFVSFSRLSSSSWVSFLHTAGDFILAIQHHDIQAVIVLWNYILLKCPIMPFRILSLM